MPAAAQGTALHLTMQLSSGARQHRVLCSACQRLCTPPLPCCRPAGSHGLAVLHDMAALGKVLHGAVSSELKPPLVVQQFVAHGGVLFKVGGGREERGEGREGGGEGVSMCREQGRPGLGGSGRCPCDGMGA